MARIDVLYDSQIFEAQAYGGVSRYFHEVITRAVRSDALDVSLFLGLSRNRYGTERLRSGCRHFFGFTHPDVPRTVELTSRINAMLIRPYARRWRPNIYHPTYYRPFLPDAHIPRVVTVHDMIHERFRQQFPDADVSIEWKKDAVSRAAHVIAVSHNTKRDLVELLGIAPEKVTVVHHAALPPVERPPHPVGPARYVLFVGLRDGYKNFDLVLKAYASASSVRQDYALICCGGPRFCRAELATMAALGVGDRVMHRSCSDLELAGHYAHASVLVYPSLYEGFGIPVLEAMAYGCPVLASDRSSIPEVAGDAALYFDPTQPEDLRTKLDRVLGDPALAGSMSEQSRANARRFSWDRTFEQTLDVYRMLVG